MEGVYKNTYLAKKEKEQKTAWELRDSASEGEQTKGREGSGTAVFTGSTVACHPASRLRSGKWQKVRPDVSFKIGVGKVEDNKCET